MKKLFFINKTIAVITAVLVFAACSSEDEVEFIDNSDALNKEFGVTNQIDESWLESIKTSDLALVFDRAEEIEYAKSNDTWEEYTEGNCATHKGVLPYYFHWTPYRIVFKDGLIYSYNVEETMLDPAVSFFDYCKIAYKKDCGIAPAYYLPSAEFGISDLTIESVGRTISIVELSDNNLIIKEEHEKCFSLAKYLFSPYFEFADGSIHGDEICVIGDTRIECNTKFFKEFKKHFGGKVNIPKLANYNAPLAIDGEVYNGDIDMNILENFLRKNNFIE